MSPSSNTSPLSSPSNAARSLKRRSSASQNIQSKQSHYSGNNSSRNRRHSGKESNIYANKASTGPSTPSVLSENRANSVGKQRHRSTTTGQAQSRNNSMAAPSSAGSRRHSLGNLTPRTALTQSNPSYQDFIDLNMQELFENRLTEMMRIRVDMKDICERQKREESSYVDTVKSMIKQMVEQKQHHTQVVEEYHKRLEMMNDELQEERHAKQKAQEMFDNFKNEGTNIIQRFRNSLGQITQQYKQERVQNQALNAKLQMLTKQLKHEKEQSEKFAELYQGALDSLQDHRHSTATTPRDNRRQSLGGAGRDSLHPEDEDEYDFDPDNDEDVRNNDPQFLRSRNRALETKVFALKRSLAKARSNQSSQEVVNLRSKLHQLQEEKDMYAQEMDNQLTEYKTLLDDEEQIIRQLRARIRSLERDNGRLHHELRAAQKNHSTSTGSFVQPNMHTQPSEFLELYNNLKNMIDPKESQFLDADPTKSEEEPITNPEQKVDAQRKLIKLLLSKLKSEEHQRLHTEEQTQQMITEQNTTITFLEKKIKGMENNHGSDASSKKRERSSSRKKSHRQSSMTRMNTVNSGETRQPQGELRRNSSSQLTDVAIGGAAGNALEEVTSSSAEADNAEDPSRGVRGNESGEKTTSGSVEVLENNSPQENFSPDKVAPSQQDEQEDSLREREKEISAATNISTQQFIPDDQAEHDNSVNPVPIAEESDDLATDTAASMEASPPAAPQDRENDSEEDVTNPQGSPHKTKPYVPQLRLGTLSSKNSAVVCDTATAAGASLNDADKESDSDEDEHRGESGHVHDTLDNSSEGRDDSHLHGNTDTAGGASGEEILSSGDDDDDDEPVEEEEEAAEKGNSEEQSEEQSIKDHNPTTTTESESQEETDFADTDRDDNNL